MKRWAIVALLIATATAAEARKPRPPEPGKSANCHNFWGDIEVEYQSEAYLVRSEADAAAVTLREPRPVTAPAGRIVVRVARYDNPGLATGAGWEVAFGELSALVGRRPLGIAKPAQFDDAKWHADFAVEPRSLPPFDLHIIDAPTETRCDVHVDADGNARRIKAKRAK